MMEELRNAARGTLQQPTASLIPESILSNITVPTAVDQLWQGLSTHNDSDHVKILEDLLVAHGFLSRKAIESVSDVDRGAINSLYEWASKIALPAPVFAEASEESSPEAQEESQQRSTLAISVISSLARLLPIEDSEPVNDVLIALASFTSEQDAWTTPETYISSTALLDGFIERSEASVFWATVESLLKTRIRPLFAKTKNPAITESGRKNFHPIPLPRFDMSILDPETKPWKMYDVYITTVFSWIVNQYKPTDRDHLEIHFPLLVPPILTMIDDDSLSFKRHGCILLSQFLIPIQESRSDILRRTNLSSVFEDAIRPCFHSLPTITPEDDSIQLLAAAYPALRSLLQTSYREALTQASRTPSMKHTKDKEAFISATTKTLRDHLIPSFHHISSADITSTSTFASFPHPRLSTLLLNQIAITCADLGIHTTKYLQDIIPLVYSTLSNMFGTAHPPLLLSALSVTRALVLNAYPRIWRWRGEILGAICSCWVNVLDDEEEAKTTENSVQKDKTSALSSPDGSKTADLGRLKRELQGAVYLLRYALENPVQADSDEGQREAKENIGREIQVLVDADESSKECLFADVNPDDGDYFGIVSI